MFPLSLFIALSIVDLIQKKIILTSELLENDSESTGNSTKIFEKEETLSGSYAIQRVEGKNSNKKIQIVDAQKIQHLGDIQVIVSEIDDVLLKSVDCSAISFQDVIIMSKNIKKTIQSHDNLRLKEKLSEVLQSGILSCNQIQKTNLDIAFLDTFQGVTLNYEESTEEDESIKTITIFYQEQYKIYKLIFCYNQKNIQINIYKSVNGSLRMFVRGEADEMIKKLKSDNLEEIQNIQSILNSSEYSKKQNYILGTKQIEEDELQMIKEVYQNNYEQSEQILNRFCLNLTFKCIISFEYNFQDSFTRLKRAHVRQWYLTSHKKKSGTSLQSLIPTYFFFERDRDDLIKNIDRLFDHLVNQFSIQNQMFFIKFQNLNLDEIKPSFYTQFPNIIEEKFYILGYGVIFLIYVIIIFQKQLQNGLIKQVILVIQFQHIYIQYLIFKLKRDQKNYKNQFQNKQFNTMSNLILSQMQAHLICQHSERLKIKTTLIKYYTIMLYAKRCIIWNLSPFDKSSFVLMVKNIINVQVNFLGICKRDIDISMVGPCYVSVYLKDQSSQVTHVPDVVNYIDFIVENVRELEYLILCYGRQHLNKTAFIAKLIIERNLTYILIEILYRFYAGFQTQNFFGYKYYIMLELFFSFGNAIYLVFSFDMSISNQYKYPICYLESQFARYNSFKQILISFAKSFYSSIMILFLITETLKDSIDSSGKIYSHQLVSLTAFIAFYNYNKLKSMIFVGQISKQTLILLFDYLLFIGMLHLFSIHQINIPNTVGAVVQFSSNIICLNLVIVIPIICCIPDIIVYFIHNVYSNSPVVQISKYEKQKQAKLKESQRRAKVTSDMKSLLKERYNDIDKNKKIVVINNQQKLKY